MSVEIKFSIFAGDKMINKVMNAVALAEGGRKIFGRIVEGVITHKTGDLDLGKLLEGLEKEYEIGFIFTENIYYKNPKYDMFSNGQKWFMIPKTLEEYYKELVTST